MRLPLIQLVAMLILLVAQYSDASENSRREPVPLDVSKPIGAIMDQLIPILQPGGIDLKLLIETAMRLVECLGIDLGSLISIPGLSLTSQSHPSSLKLEESNQTLSPGFLLPENINETISAYCNTPDFKTIHTFIWVQDKQLNDVVKFLRDYGYPNIYPALKGIYQFFKCPEELINTLPNGPNAVTSSRQKRNTLPNVREQVLNDNFLKQAEEPDCEILDMLMKLLTSGALKLLTLLETTLDQIGTQPSLHFFIGKIQEPVKGPSFRKFRLLTPTRKLFLQLNQALMSNEAVQMILKIVKDLVGIDLTELTDNLVETVVTILEGFLWWNWEPVPAFSMPKPNMKLLA